MIIAEENAIYSGGIILFLLFQEGSICQLTGHIVKQKTGVASHMVRIGIGKGIHNAVVQQIISVIISAAAGKTVGDGFVEDIAVPVGKEDLVHRDAFFGDHLAVKVGHGVAVGIQLFSGFCFLCLRCGFRRDQVHILAGNGEGVGLGAGFLFRVQAFENIAFLVHNGIAIGGKMVGERIPAGITGDFFRTAAQDLISIPVGNLIGGFRSQKLDPLGDDFLHGFVIQVTFHQRQGTGGSSHDAHQRSGTQKDGKGFQNQTVFHLQAPFHFVTLAPDYF